MAEGIDASAVVAGASAAIAGNTAAAEAVVVEDAVEVVVVEAVVVEIVAVAVAGSSTVAIAEVARLTSPFWGLETAAQVKKDRGEAAGCQEGVVVGVPGWGGEEGNSGILLPFLDLRSCRQKSLEGPEMIAEASFETALDNLGCHYDCEIMKPVAKTIHCSKYDF